MKKALIKSFSRIGSWRVNADRGSALKKHLGARGTAFLTQNGICPLSQSKINLSQT